MKVSGFTFVRNAVKYGYPLVESVRSILPLVDEMVIVAGDSEDETLSLIESIDSDKIRVIHSRWNESLREGGYVLAEETNKALDAVAPDADWLFYLQADEVVHEQDHEAIRGHMKRFLPDKRVEGFLFRYHHFYGSYRLLADGRKWYVREVRIIRNDPAIRSYRDAQGFRKEGRKLNVKPVPAWIYHYGWVKNPVVMHRKVRDFGKWWNNDQVHNSWVSAFEKRGTRFDYSQIDSVTAFEGTHPAVMEQRLGEDSWEEHPDDRRKNFKNFKHRLYYYLWKKLGWRPFSYKNYRVI